MTKHIRVPCGGHLTRRSSSLTQSDPTYRISFPAAGPPLAGAQAMSKNTEQRPQPGTCP